MSHHRDTHTRPCASRTRRRLRLSLALIFGVAVSLLLAPPALAQFRVKQLHLGSTSGAVDYLFAAGNTVVEQGTVDQARYYRFDVSDPSGTVRLTTACRPSPGSRVVAASYTLQSGDPLSNTTAWRFRLREFSSSATCSSATSAQHDASLYFDVAAATSYKTSALATKQSAFGAGSTAYVQVAGAGRVSSSATNSAQKVGTWSTSWILPSGATACANTSNNNSDLAGSTAAGQLPDRTSLGSPAQPNLQYRPSSSSSVDAWNVEANYETRPCQDFANGNQGQWSLLLSADSTHFVKLPVFTVDTTPPDTTLTAAPSGVTSSTSATFSFTSTTSGSTFQCSLDSATWTTCTSPQNYLSLASAVHAFSVRAIDPAGNVDPTPATSSWTIDTTAPMVALTAPAAGSYTSNATPAFSGTADTIAGDSGVTVDVYSGTGTGGTPVQALNATVGGGSGWTVNASTLADGTYTAQAQQTNAASKTGYSELHTFTVDTTPPAVTLSAPASGTHTNATTPTLSGTAGTAASDSSTVTVTITGGSSSVQATASVSPSGTWAVDAPQPLADGNYTVQASQQDLAGNTGYSFTHSLTVDTTPPQTVIDAGPVGTTSSSTATFTFHATDALSQAGTTFQCQLDGDAWGACNWPQSYFNLANGSHTFSVQAIDGAGNVDTAGQTVTWTVNTALPAVTLDAPADGSFTNDTTPSFSGGAGTAAGDSSTVQVLIYNGTDLSGSPVQTLNASAASDGSWSATASTLADGTYVAYAQQTGVAGTATSNDHTFTVLTQAPTTTITVGPPGNAGTGSASFSFSSSASGATFQCQLDGSGWTSCTSPKDYSGLGSGSHTFQVRSIDQAGNAGSPASQTWSVNTNLPAVNLTAPSDGSETNSPMLTIGGTGGVASGDSSTVTVKIYSGTNTAGSALQTIATTVSSGSGAWSTHPNPGLQDGAYTVFAQQDGSGGTAYTAASTFTVDTYPPTTSVISGPQGTTSATTARFTFTSSDAGSSFQCQLDGGTWTGCGSPQSYSSLALGAHTFSVRATDPVGNVDPTPPVVSWTVDTPANVPVTLTSPADGTSTTNTAPTFSGAANAANGDITVEIDDLNGDPVETLAATAGSTWSVAASPALPDGSYTAFASQLASDGITVDYSATVAFTVDTTPPTVTLTTAPTATTNHTTPSFGGGAGTATGDSGTVTLDIYSGTSASGTPVQTIQASASGNSWSATASTLADGTYTVRAHQTDAAGNTGYTSKRTFTIDTVPPQTSITSQPSASTTVASATFAFTSSKSGSTFECRLDGAAWTACTPPETYTGLAAGQHTFAVRATDTAGNVDPNPPSFTWTIAGPSTPPPSTTGGTSTTGTTTTTGGSGAGTTTPPPTKKLQLTLTTKTRQRLSRRGQLTLRVLCPQACSLVLTGKLAIVAKAKHGVRAKPSTRTLKHMLKAALVAGKRVTLALKLTASTRKAILAALANGQQVTLTLTGTASAPGALPGSAQVTLRLVR